MGQKRFTIGITPAGNYDPNTEYKILARVYDETTNCSYISRRNGNRNHSVLDTTWWQKDTDGGIILGPFTREEYDQMVADDLINDDCIYAIAEDE